MSSANVPLTFICPITQEIMRDPVVDREGNSYEREAIMQWVSEHGTSPITRSQLTVHDLVTNRALRDAIEEFNNGNISPAVPSEVEQVDVNNDVEEGFTIDLKTTELIEELGAHKVIISINPCEGKGRVPVDLSCVIDVSVS